MKRRLLILPLLAGFVLSGCEFKLFGKTLFSVGEKEEKTDTDNNGNSYSEGDGNQSGDNGSQSGGNTQPATKWSDAVLADMRANLLGETIPFIASGSWDWYYDDYYECYSGESEDANLAAAKDVFNGKNGFVFSYNDSYGDPFYDKTTPTPEDSNRYLSVNVYEDDGEVWVDCYLEFVEYNEWPTTLLASMLAEAELDVTVPKYESANFSYQVGVMESEESGKYVALAINDNAETDAEVVYSVDAYCDILEAAGFVLYDEDDSSVTYRDAAKKAVINVADNDGYGLILSIAKYVPDYTIQLEYGHLLLAKDDTYDVLFLVSDDYGDEDVFTITSADPTIVSVDELGTLTALAVGSTTVTVDGGKGETATMTIYVAESLPTEFTAAQKAEINKMSEGLADAVPFDAHFETAVYIAESEEEDEGVAILGDSDYVCDYSNHYDYCEALEDAGWEDISEDYGITNHLYIYFDIVQDETTGEYDIIYECYPIAIYELKFADHYYNATVLLLSDQFEMAEEGTLAVQISDPYIYDFDVINAGLAEYFTDLGLSEAPALPAIDGDHYSVDDENMIVYAYNSTTTVAAYKTALEGQGYTVEEVTETDEEEGTSFTYYVATYTLTVEGVDHDIVYAFASQSGTFMIQLQKVTGFSGFADSLEDLYDGAEIAIVAAESNAALGAYNGKKFFAAVDFEDEFDPENDKVLHLFLEETDDGWRLVDEDGTYYGADGSKNIKTDADSSANLEWEISFDEQGVATLQCGTNVLMYNQQDPRFKTYAPGTSKCELVQIYIY